MWKHRFGDYNFSNLNFINFFIFMNNFYILTSIFYFIMCDIIEDDDEDGRMKGLF